MLLAIRQQVDRDLELVAPGTRQAVALEAEAAELRRTHELWIAGARPPELPPVAPPGSRADAWPTKDRNPEELGTWLLMAFALGVAVAVMCMRVVLKVLGRVGP
jgi:hypothetical protein